MIRKYALGSIAVAGAYFGFVVGAGYTSGQEVFQYFASHGYGMFFSILTYAVIATLLTPELMRTGHREQFSSQGGIFEYYCGKVVGKFYDYFAHFFLFASFVVMISASGALLHQYFGLNELIGLWSTAALAGFCAVLGFERITRLLSRFGPILIAIMLVVCITSIFTSDTSFSEGVSKMSRYDVMSAADNWFMSAVNYIGFAIFWAAPFLAKYSKTIENRKVAVTGQAIGEIVLALVAVVISVALIKNIDTIADTQVPILKLASEINSGMGGVFSVLMWLAIFSTVVPLLILSVSRVVPEGTSKGKVGMLVAAAVGAVIASTLPFDELMNYVYVANGYVGILFIFFMIVKMIRRTFMSKTPVEQLSVRQE